MVSVPYSSPEPLEGDAGTDTIGKVIALNPKSDAFKKVISNHQTYR